MNFISAEWAYSDMAFAFTQPNYADELTPNVSRYYPFLSVYDEAYVNISKANTLISRIDDIIWENEGNRNVVLAEAYFFRSYWYYRLVNAYGDVPFEGEEVTRAKLDYYSHSRWTILSKIQSDMEFAVKWLREKVMPGEISRGAGNHLLAKICLANTDFDGAIKAANDVINGPYALMHARFGEDKDKLEYNYIWDLHRVHNKNLPENTETILAVVDRYSDPAGAKNAVGTYSMRLYNPAVWNNSVRDSEGKPGMVQSGTAFRMYGRGNNNAKPFPYYTYDIWSYGGYDYTNTTDLRRSDANWVDLHELTYTNPASVDYGKPINPAYFANYSDTIYC
ncbi:MAG: RagB/SusD family nutrient uptake outer membrane protein, partial [Tannerella sp.]|nr:RagB/SusD family nutrient uptake outer membrane protein [Tannerella sp.]